MRNVFYETSKRTLKQNKTRAAVTLIGVIISVAMITAIILGTYSIHNFLVEATKDSFGNWGIAVKNIDQRMLDDANRQKLVYGKSQAVGYSYLHEGVNPQKPFLYLVNIDQNMEDISNLDIVEGRMPRNDKEIVLPEHLSTNGGVTHKIGDVITMDVGMRVGIKSGNDLNQIIQYSAQDEVFISDTTMKFKVVGICKRMAIEPYLAPGYTAITYNVKPVMDEITTFFSDDDYQKTNKLVDKYYFDKKDIRYNSELLSIKGDIGGLSGNKHLYALATIMLFLVSVGACMLLYNTFAISNRESKKQYEIMVSVGATEKQLRRTALYEGFFFGFTGIPIGIILGAIGTYIIILVFGDKTADLLASNTSATIEMTMSPGILLIAIVISAIVLQLSIIVPAYKAGKTKAIAEYDYEALSRKAQKNVVKQSRIMYRLFGGEGLLASKNFKRNMRQYRSTIVSLVMSIVLFVSASGLTIYVQNGIDTMMGVEDDYDILYSEENSTEAEEAYYTLANVEGVTKQAFVTQGYLSAQIGKTPYSYNIFIIDDDTFKEYLRQFNIIVSDYFDEDNPKAIGISNVLVYNANKNRIEQKEIFKENARDYFLKGVIGGTYVNINIGTYVDKMPNEIFSTVNMPTVVMSKTASKNLMENVGSEAFSGRALFKAQNISQTYTAMETICRDNGYPQDNLSNMQKARDEAASILTIIKIFSFGFILLMSLISIANVFNTISSNVDMRKMEFATLKALGMTNKEFKRMVYYECLIIAAKTLLYGIPLALIGLFIVFKTVSISVVTGYIIPVKSIFISVVCVTAVMIVVMIYAVSKLNEDDPAKILKEYMF